jgi:hypothetical protein
VTIPVSFASQIGKSLINVLQGCRCHERPQTGDELMRTVAILIAAAFVSSCAQTKDVAEEIVGVSTPWEETNAIADTCGSEKLQHLLGHSITEFDAANYDGPVRVLGVNDIYTEDYRPERLNIFVDANGTVVNLYCQ